MVLAGKMITKEEADQFREVIKEGFMKGGEKRFIEIIKDEFKDLAMDVEINIKGKQGNMAEIVSKLNSVFRTLFTPGAIQVLQQSPEMGKFLNEILELTGLSPIKFGMSPKPILTQMTQPQKPQTLPAPA